MHHTQSSVQAPACLNNSVVDYLKSVLPLGFWAVTRFDSVRQR